MKCQLTYDKTLPNLYTQRYDPVGSMKSISCQILPHRNSMTQLQCSLAQRALRLVKVKIFLLFSTIVLIGLCSFKSSPTFSNSKIKLYAIILLCLFYIFTIKKVKI